MDTIQTLKDAESLITRAQGILTAYLVPDGLSSAQAIDQLLTLFDGPEQRRIQAAMKTLINEGAR